jgi:hypothetical protein
VDRGIQEEVCDSCAFGCRVRTGVAALHSGAGDTRPGSEITEYCHGTRDMNTNQPKMNTPLFFSVLLSHASHGDIREEQKTFRFVQPLSRCCVLDFASKGSHTIEEVIRRVL